jgi:hypothetical protein
MLSIISSGNRGCCSSTVPIREPPLAACHMMAALASGGNGSTVRWLWNGGRLSGKAELNTVWPRVEQLRLNLMSLCGGDCLRASSTVLPMLLGMGMTSC